MTFQSSLVSRDLLQHKPEAALLLILSLVSVPRSRMPGAKDTLAVVAH